MNTEKMREAFIKHWADQVGDGVDWTHLERLAAKEAFAAGWQAARAGGDGEAEPVEITEKSLIEAGFTKKDLGDEVPYEQFFKDGVCVWNFNDKYWLVDALDQACINKEFCTMQELALFFNACGLSLAPFDCAHPPPPAAQSGGETVVLDGCESYESLLNAEANGCKLQLVSICYPPGSLPETWSDFRDRQAKYGGGLEDFPPERYRAVFPAPAAKVPDDAKERVRDAIAEAIGADAYDCVRVWSAWGVGTMGPDDFVPIVDDEDRLTEIVDAALNATPQPAEQVSNWRPQIERAIQMAKVFDDGTDGADAESARSVVDILSGLLSTTPTPEGGQ